MSEMEYLNSIDVKLSAVFDLAVEARDEAQAAIVATQAIKSDLLRRKIELQKALLAETREKSK